MNTDQKTAIVLGATGLTGSHLVKKLLADKRYGQVKIFSRNQPNISHDKLTVFICDLLQLSDQKKNFIGDEVYCCIGTTAKKTPDKEVYKKIDYGIPISAAKLCAENNIPTFSVMSSMGADSKSSIFYNRTKGEMENEVMDQQINNTFILRPSIIIGKRNESRFGESFGKVIMSLFQPLMLGPLRKYQPINSEIIAEAMIVLANTKTGKDMLESDEIKSLVKR